MSLYPPGLPENSVVSINDDNIGIAKRYARKYNYPIYQDCRQMIMETKFNFVFILAPHYRMKNTAEYLLRLDIPFPMEKPAGMNVDEVEPLCEFYEKKNGSYPVPFVWHYSDTINELKNEYLTKPIIRMSYRSIAGPPSRYLETSSWMFP